MKPNPVRSPDVILRDGDAIDRAMVAAHREVIRRHRLLRVPLVIWRGGRVVEVSPESVELPAGEGAQHDDPQNGTP